MRCEEMILHASVLARFMMIEQAPMLIADFRKESDTTPPRGAKPTLIFLIASDACAREDAAVTPRAYACWRITYAHIYFIIALCISRRLYHLIFKFARRRRCC